MILFVIGVSLIFNPNARADEPWSSLLGKGRPREAKRQPHLALSATLSGPGLCDRAHQYHLSHRHGVWLGGWHHQQAEGFGELHEVGVLRDEDLQRVSEGIKALRLFEPSETGIQAQLKLRIRWRDERGRFELQAENPRLQNDQRPWLFYHALSALIHRRAASPSPRYLLPLLPRERGTLKLEPAPAARIEINGVLLEGRSPALIQLPIGRHQLRLWPASASLNPRKPGQLDASFPYEVEVHQTLLTQFRPTLR